MKKILSDLAKVFVFILIMYLPVSLMNMYFDLQRLEERENGYRSTRLEFSRDKLIEKLDEGRSLEACQYLNAEYGARSLTAYKINFKQDYCKNDDVDSEFLELETKNAIVPSRFGNNHRFVVSHATEQYSFAMVADLYQVQLLNSPNAKIEGMIWWAIIKDLVVNIYTLLLFITLAVLILSKSIQNQFKKEGVDPFWFRIINKFFGWLQLGDLKIIKSAINAMIRKHESVVRDNDLLETSLEHSILNEIKSKNQQLPFKFHGAVAKVDINGFSKVVSAGQSVEAQTLSTNLEEFGCELLLRYKGLFEKTVGDEIVVVFKTADAMSMAAAFARDLMNEFANVEFDIAGEKRNFTLKSSIYKSEIIFQKRPSGFGFFGDALTYTTRLLDVIKERDRNILSCLRSQISEIQDLVIIPSDLRRFEFKNMAEQEGFLVDKFLSFEEALARQVNLLWFYRSDESICKMFNILKVESDANKIEMVFKTFNDLNVRQVGPEVIQSYLKTLKIFEKRTLENPAFSFAFSRLIIEGSRLIPSHQWNEDCTQAVISISRFIEGRVNASIVDVLIEKDLSNIALEHENSFILEKDTSFRTKGNLLISEANVRLSDSVFDRIIKMIKSSNKLESSTGIYCACRIIIDYRLKNPAELETFMSYRKLSDILRNLQRTNSEAVSDRLSKLLDQVNAYNELTY